MENMILTPVSVLELVNLIADEVEVRINRPEHIEPPQDRISLHEACLLTGSSKSQIYKQTMQGSIPFQKFGKRLVFSRKAVLDWMESHTVSTPTAGNIMADRLSASARKGLKK
jgi:excisionase family DNA binding protein